jgi:single stranded DNA-binding protein
MFPPGIAALRHALPPATHAGAAYADFTLAVSRTKELKTFFPVRVFGKLAETCDRVKKGTKVLVEGNLDISEYTDEEGQKKMTFRVLADTYRLLQRQRGGLKGLPYPPSWEWRLPPFPS